MSFADTYNEPEFNFELTDEHDFINLAGLVAEYHLEYVHIVRAININTAGEYGDAGIITTNTHLVNLPTHLTSKLRDILANKKNISDINAGKVGFSIKEYENKYGTQLTIKWINVIPAR